jgi:hypothetical protein
LSQERWPNLFVVGASKAGTTSLWRWLGAHPEIYMSPVKEPHFFSGFDPKLLPVVHGEREYLALFAGARDEKLLGEASYSYLWKGPAAGRIKAKSPDAQIVIALRDPVERAYSSYWNQVRGFGEQRSFAEVAEEGVAAMAAGRYEDGGSIGPSFYAEAVEQYLELFGDAVHVVVFEELAADARAEVRRLYGRLGVDPGLADGLDFAPQNEFALPKGRLAARLLSSGPARKAARVLVPLPVRERIERAFLRGGPKPELDEATRARLREVYAPDVERLRGALGRDLPWG